MRYVSYSSGILKLNLPAGVVRNYHQPGAVSALDPITLPNSMTYEGDELTVLLNNVPQEYVVDYNYEGAGPIRTQISFTKDILVTDTIGYIINREIA